jgi:hypothetical protein
MTSMKNLLSCATPIALAFAIQVCSLHPLMAMDDQLKGSHAAKMPKPSAAAEVQPAHGAAAVVASTADNHGEKHLKSPVLQQSTQENETESLQRQIANLEQELARRKATEEDLNKTIAGLKAALEVVQQKVIKHSEAQKELLVAINKYRKITATRIEAEAEAEAEAADAKK